MLQRYKSLCPFLNKLNLKRTTGLLLSPKQDLIIVLLVVLKKFYLVTKVLQKGTTTAFQAQSLLDSIFEDFPSTGRQLNPNTDVYCSPYFKPALCKLQDRTKDSLINKEVSSIGMLLCKWPSQVVTDMKSNNVMLARIKRSVSGASSH